MTATPNSHPAGTIVLPSGRSLEVHTFVASVESEPRELHVCPACDANSVQPHDWVETPHGSWQMRLTCPDCGWAESGTYSNDEVEAYEDHLGAEVEA
jgi:ribosomal protein L37AE/L43A